MRASDYLRDNVNLLMEVKKWTSNKDITDASDGRLTNGTLGRIRSTEGENTKLSQVDELARVFGVAPHELLEPPKNERGTSMAKWPFTPELLAAIQMLDARTMQRIENAARNVLDMEALPIPPIKETKSDVA